MLHGAVKVAAEAVLDEQGGKVQGPEHQLLEAAVLVAGPVALQQPGAGLPPGGRFQDVIAQVKDVDPVVKLTLPVRPGLYLFQLR